MYAKRHVNMNIKYFLSLLCLVTMIQVTSAEISPKASVPLPLKPRLVVLTDIAPGDVEPDDMQSMIRLLVHADLFEIEALIASGGWNSSGRSYPLSWMDILFRTIDAYEKDITNLMKRSEQNSFLALSEENQRQEIGYWPSTDYLRNRVMPGSLNLGYKELGEDNDSQGSDFIIQLVDEADDRPLWVAVWGGGNTLAQAIWRVRQERTEKELSRFLSKLRVYTITDQDLPWGERHSNYSFSSHQWMRREFEKELLFIWDESAWLSQNGIGAGKWDEYATHIQNHGNLGKIYPKNKYGVEGDTPSFLHLMPNGLNDPEKPGQVGWGGYFEWGPGMDNATYCFTNHAGEAKETSNKYETYFYPAIFNNFAARMDWAKEGKGNRNPVVVVNGKKGREIVLDASESFDPDGDQLSYKWLFLPEASSYSGVIELENASTSKSTIKIPSDAAGESIHIVCEVTDNGTPKLTSYKRIIINPVESAQDIPLVYNTESSVTPFEVCLPALKDLPVIEKLPDPFAWSDGSGRSTRFEDWGRRRMEIGAEIQHYEIGKKPVRPDSITADFSDDNLTVWINVNGEQLVLKSHVILPEGEGPFPAVIGIGRGSGSLPAELFSSRDIAQITFNFAQVMSWQQKRGEEPINRLYPDLVYMGAYSAWSWGVSRLIDGLELVADQLPIDLQHIAITGCSFAGKMALYAAAFDERIALTIAQESGGGGAASWRVSETLGEVETLGRTSHLWFMEEMFQFSDAVNRLPFDHHELMAMIAPRALLVLGNPDYEWLADESGFISCKAAKRVWETFGIEDRFGFSIVAGHGHCVLPDVQRPEVEAFIDKFLLGDETAKTNIEIHPYSSEKVASWID